MHEPYLSLTTDVANKPEFTSRRATYNMDDDDPLVDWNDKGDVTDWFSFDFTLEASITFFPLSPSPPFL